MTTYYIGADVHSNHTELAIEKRGKIVKRYSVPTTIPAIANVLDSLDGKKYFAIEEGPMSGWIYRNLSKRLDCFISSDPRRNKWICSDGDKDDKIDSAKLASLLRGGYLHAVHHSDDTGRAELKHWVSLYHDRVRDAVRSINKIRACCRMHGISISRAAVRNPSHRTEWLLKTNQNSLTKQLKMLWIGYDATAQQVGLARCQLRLLSKKFDIIGLWSQLPGVGLIRATTIFAYLDTPWRFKKRSKLWKYCGVGLERTASGTDKKGSPKPARLRLPRSVNGAVKNAVMGAAQTAIKHRGNVFRDYYERMVKDGIIPCNARHALARKLLSVLWAMWKTSSPFDEKLVCAKLD